MSKDRQVGRKPRRALMFGAAVGLFVAVLLVTYFTAHSRQAERNLKPTKAPLSTQNEREPLRGRA